MNDLDTHDLIVLRDYLANKWFSFVDHCNEYGCDANVIYKALGGEADD